VENEKNDWAENAGKIRGKTAPRVKRKSYTTVDTDAEIGDLG